MASEPKERYYHLVVFQTEKIQATVGEMKGDGSGCAIHPSSLINSA